MRHQRPRCTRHARRHGVDHRQTCVHMNANRHRTQSVIAHRHQGGTPGRMNHTTRQHKQQQQHRQRIPSSGLPHQIELKTPQHRPEHHALQAIGATGQPVQLVGQLQQDQSHAQRHHQARQIAAAQNRHRAQRTQTRCRHGAHQQTHQGVRHHQLGKQRGSVCAKPQKGCMPQRHDAGITQHQIERHTEQGHDGNLVQDQGMLGQAPRCRKGNRPKQRLPRLEACRVQQSVTWRHHLPPWRTNKPWGRQIKITNISEYTMNAPNLGT